MIATMKTDTLLPIQLETSLQPKGTACAHTHADRLCTGTGHISTLLLRLGISMR